ncbi:MAG: hypothetical protein KBT73_05840 [Marinobacter sp.]|nr:hypothetical protein [Marinobacter sp.]
MNSQQSIWTYITDLANQLGIRYEKTPEDELADVITRLSDDEVENDEIQNLIQVLYRAGALNKKEMLDLLHRHLVEKHSTQ